MPLRRGSQLKHRDNFTFLPLCVRYVPYETVSVLDEIGSLVVTFGETVNLLADPIIV